MCPAGRPSSSSAGKPVAFGVLFAREAGVVAARVRHLGECSARAIPGYVRAGTLASSRVRDGTGLSSWPCDAVGVPAVPGLLRFGREAGWTAPGILEAVKPGRMQGHGGTAEVSGGAA